MEKREGEGGIDGHFFLIIIIDETRRGPSLSRGDYDARAAGRGCDTAELSRSHSHITNILDLENYIHPMHDDPSNRGDETTAQRQRRDHARNS